LGPIKNYRGQRQVDLFFTAGQKYAELGSGQVRAHLYNIPLKVILKQAAIGVSQGYAHVRSGQGPSLHLRHTETGNVLVFVQAIRGQMLPGGAMFLTQGPQILSLML